MKRKKKIAFITTGFNPVPAVNGGAVQVLNNYIIDDNEKYNIFDIDLFTIDDKKLRNVTYKNTTIYKIRINKIINCFYKVINKINKLTFKFDFLLLDYPRQVMKVMKDIDYDKIIVENNMYMYKELYKKYKFKNVPIYFHLHNNVGDLEKNYANSLLISQTAAKVICVSNFLCNSFNSFTNSNITELLYNCIDFSIFNLKKLTSLKKEDFELKKDEFYYIYTGRIDINKGISELVSAFNRLCLKYKNISLIIIGFNNLDNQTSFEKGIYDLVKTSKKIVPLKFMNSDMLKKYVYLSDVVVIPTKIEEGFGVVALEAMALKKGIIATSSGGLIEPLNNDCSIIIDRNNLENNLYDSMEKIYNDTKLLKRISNNAYKRVHEVSEFDRENYFVNFVKAIDEKIGDKN